MQFLLHVTCSYLPMHTYSFFNILAIFELFGTLLTVSFFPLSLLFTLVVSMAPKFKSTPSRNLLHSRAFSSSNPTPSHLRFRDDDAHKAFLKNFSRHGIHLECQVILANFANTDLPDVIHSRGWESLCDIPVTCPLMLIQEFYSNMHKIDRSVPLFFTRIRRTRISVTPQLITDVFRVPRVEFPNYPGCSHLRTVFKDELKSAFCERPLE